ncbi:hypothetical protein GYMLUDRAFT_242849 [Collybiopsis luxurians FD-317 M1]|uniref:Uncharacterized protein n=1 Tax=Collybiopsis luxurians FD-317 M1 TaxID=944289 RepID=A0A0D0CZU6_9AGAR|nr:hypothetical protein GYMLUDRAFT_242849 [Collybiopsis luxurians FD-317 M1]
MLLTNLVHSATLNDGICELTVVFAIFDRLENVDNYMTENMDINLNLTRYLGSLQRAHHFREAQRRLGAVLSGYWSYIFLLRCSLSTIPIFPLDIFIDHPYVKDMASVLFPMDFKYCHTTLEIPPDNRHVFCEAFNANVEVADACTEGGIVYCFTNRKVVIRVYGATHGIMNAIFEQHSLMEFNVITATEAWSIFPASSFDSREPPPTVAGRTFNWITDGCCASLGISIGAITRPRKELHIGPHQFGDGSMWKVQLKPFEINNRTALILSTISPVSHPMQLHGWSIMCTSITSRLQLIYRLTNCSFLTMEYSMPRWVEIILESNEETALLHNDDGWLIDFVTACYQRNRILSTVTWREEHPISLRPTSKLW